MDLNYRTADLDQISRKNLPTVKNRRTMVQPRGLVESPSLEALKRLARHLIEMI